MNILELVHQNVLPDKDISLSKALKKYPESKGYIFKWLFNQGGHRTLAVYRHRPETLEEEYGRLILAYADWRTKRVALLKERIAKKLVENKNPNRARNELKKLMVRKDINELRDWEKKHGF